MRLSAHRAGDSPMLVLAHRSMLATSVALAIAYGAALAQSAGSSDGSGGAPRVMIDSRDYSSGTLHVLGFFDGTDLKSAAIFDHGVKIRDIKVSDTPGSQRVTFDFRVANPSPGQVLVVVDDRGRMARAQLAPDAPSRGEPGPPPEPTEDSRVEPGGERVAPMPPASEPGNVAEIPARGGDDSMSDSGTHRRLSGGLGRLGDVKIHVISMTPVMSQPGSYEVTGQLAGPGIRRAGIYLDGRPIKPI